MHKICSVLLKTLREIPLEFHGMARWGHAMTDKKLRPVDC